MGTFDCTSFFNVTPISFVGSRILFLILNVHVTLLTGFFQKVGVQTVFLCLTRFMIMSHHRHYLARATKELKFGQIWTFMAKVKSGQLYANRLNQIVVLQIFYHPTF